MDLNNLDLNTKTDFYHTKDIFLGFEKLSGTKTYSKLHYLLVVNQKDPINKHI